jgi:hypothetical protein
VTAERDWILVGPWYRWRRQAVPARETRPVFQKYDTSNPVAAFKTDPQHSLKFTDEDLVHSIITLPDLPPLASPMQHLKRRFSNLSRVPSDIRKLYLDAHKRFYLVVCELHTDGPGFPCVDRREVCEAGLVIRRRRTTYPSDAEQEARGIVRDLERASLELARARMEAPPIRLALVRDARANGTGNGNGTAEATTPADDAAMAAISARRDEVQRERSRLTEWADRVGAQQRSEGWVPSTAADGVGAWRDVGTAPATLTEKAVRLFPLVATEAAAELAADRATLYFGLLPTGSSDTTADGASRFDDRSLYEVRCYVRRHDPRCPKTGKPGDCHGELVWSRPSEPYRLASHFDLAGTGNRPVTVQLPDLRALEAEAASLPVGKAAPFRLQAPADSNLEFDVDAATMQMSNATRGEAICSFAIPLITIVATFVLKLFLPVVVFLFNLWFLLRLKFCIPPSVELTASLDAALAASGNVDLDVGVQAQLRAEFDANFGTGAGARLTGEYSNGTLVQLRHDLAIDASAGPGFATDLTEGLEWEEPEARFEVALR